MKYELVLFDLDGTLIDTSPGIFHSIRYAEKMMNLPPVSSDKLPAFIGLPTQDSYRKYYSLDEDRVIRASLYHRQYELEKGLYESQVYPGMHGLLERLLGTGVKCGVTTIKAQETSEDILRHHGLTGFFEVVLGSDKQESFTKDQLIRRAIRLAKAEGAVVLIGDSRYDAIGAKKAGVDFMGVLYGFDFAQKEDIDAFDNVGVARDCFELAALLAE